MYGQTGAGKTFTMLGDGTSSSVHKKNTVTESLSPNKYNQ